MTQAITTTISGQMWVMIISKFTKKAGFHHLSRKHTFAKPQSMKLTHPPPSVYLWLRDHRDNNTTSSFNNGNFKELIEFRANS